MAEPSARQTLLSPAFEKGYWRTRRRVRYRDYANFSRKKGHFEPEDRNAFAERWAAELTREESAAEIRQIYENAVVILGNRRSSMERSDTELEAPQFRFTFEARQDPEDPAQILEIRSLWVKAPLNKLPEHFDDLFPYRPSELVVPFTGNMDRREILMLLEDWEAELKGKLGESADQSIFCLNLGSGFSLTVDLLQGETVFAKRSFEGVCSLGPALAQDIKGLRIRKKLV